MPDYKKIRYHFDNLFFLNPKPCGDFVLYQTGEIVCDGGTVIREHRQICFEVTFIVEGEAEVFCDGESLMLQKHEFFLSFEGERHKIVAPPTVQLRYRYVAVNCFSNKEKAEQLTALRSLTRTNGLRSGRCAALNEDFLSIFSEISGGAAFCNSMIGHTVSVMIIRMLRALSGGMNRAYSEPINSASMLAFQTAKYIDTHITELKNLSELTAVFNYNYQYISNNFSAIMNTPLHDYFLRARMEYAKRRLAEQSVSIAQVSEELNYSSVHVFSRAFKSQTGLPPGEFRRRTVLRRGT